MAPRHALRDRAVPPEAGVAVTSPIEVLQDAIYSAQFDIIRLEEAIAHLEAMPATVPYDEPPAYASIEVEKPIPIPVVSGPPVYVVQDDQVECEVCFKFFHRNGIGPHRRSHRNDGITVASFDPDVARANAAAAL